MSIILLCAISIAILLIAMLFAVLYYNANKNKQLSQIIQDATKNNDNVLIFASETDGKSIPSRISVITNFDNCNLQLSSYMESGRQEQMPKSSVKLIFTQKCNKEIIVYDSHDIIMHGKLESYFSSEENKRNYKLIKEPFIDDLNGKKDNAGFKIIECKNLKEFIEKANILTNNTKGCITLDDPSVVDATENNVLEH
ncbi:hypothetical protein [Wolbachia endosymbiont of Pentidionis agamae]|uniref:hypothetical protein n=1 Tax=Wolbachia endosymbiont of Pentidionis agamae TaxID=3110435 RepID=UPI002FD74685